MLFALLGLAMASYAQTSVNHDNGTAATTGTPAVGDEVLPVDVNADKPTKYDYAISSLQREVEQLRLEVDSLKNVNNVYEVDDEESSSSSSGLGFFGVILAILCSAVGGVIALYLSKYLAKKETPQKPMADNNNRQKPVNTPTPKPITTPTPKVAVKYKDTQPKKVQETVETKMEDPFVIDDTPTVKQKEERPAKKAPAKDKIRIAYGKIMILSASQLIVKDSMLNDSNKDFPFEFKINETRNTATYTFTPEVLASLLSNLSTYEPIVEPFDFVPSAQTVVVEKPGTLRHEAGYWQVDEKIVITLK